MDNKDRYNLLKNLLDEGIKDEVILGRKLGYKSEKDNNVKTMFRRFIKQYPELKQLHTDLITAVTTEEIIKNNDKSNDITTMNNISTFEDLVKVSDNNPVMRILTNKIMELEKDISNQNNYKEEIESQNILVLDDKYNNIDQDDIIPVSLRMTRESKKALDKFSRENSGYKKIHIVSQMIMEFVERYKG